MVLVPDAEGLLEEGCAIAKVWRQTHSRRSRSICSRSKKVHVSMPPLVGSGQERGDWRSIVAGGPCPCLRADIPARKSFAAAVSARARAMLRAFCEDC